MTSAFICGHVMDEPLNYFGRGQLRARRVAQYFNRKCPVCAVKSAASSEEAERLLGSYHSEHQAFVEYGHRLVTPQGDREI